MRSSIFLLSCLLLAAVPAHADISVTEREALIALYHATDGPNWIDNTNWLGPPGTESTWFGVLCTGCPGSYVRGLDLSSNNLSGTIPEEVGDFKFLDTLFLDNNHLEGTIPPELGDLQILYWLRLNSNRIRGEIPPEIVNLADLGPGQTDIGYNALWTEDFALQTFLDAKDPDWAETQTIAPADVMASWSDESEVSLTWSPIAFTSENGGYRVSYSASSGGPYTLLEVTASKHDDGFVVHGLSSIESLFFVVESQTNPHPGNMNTVISDPSREASVSGQIAPVPALGHLGTAVFVVALALVGIIMVRRFAA